MGGWMVSGSYFPPAHCPLPRKPCFPTGLHALTEPSEALLGEVMREKAEFNSIFSHWHLMPASQVSLSPTFWSQWLCYPQVVLVFLIDFGTFVPRLCTVSWLTSFLQLVPVRGLPWPPHIKDPPHLQLLHLLPSTSLLYIPHNTIFYLLFAYSLSFHHF